MSSANNINPSTSASNHSNAKRPNTKPTQPQHQQQSKFKSKKKPSYLQAGHEGFLVVLDDQSVEKSGKIVNEIISFLETFSAPIDYDYDNTVENNYASRGRLSQNDSPSSNAYSEDIDDFPPLESATGISTTSTATSLTEASNLSNDFRAKLRFNNKDKAGSTTDNASNDICATSASSSFLPPSPPHNNNEAGSSKSSHATSPAAKTLDTSVSQSPKSYSSVASNNLPSSVLNSPTTTQVKDNGYAQAQPARNYSSSPRNNNPNQMVQLSDIASNNNSYEGAKGNKGLSKIQLKKKQFYQMQSRTFNMEKPQLKFSTPVVNDNSPFKPLLSFKPHALVPLNLQPMKDPKTGKIFYPHPYQTEIDEWQPTNAMMDLTPYEWPFRTLPETQCFIVQSLQSLKMMMRDLHEVEEIAFDVEHSDRSFFGLTCLIQISTRFKDYIVDCFSLRDHLQCLNEVFTNPRVLKVAHSANCDIIYLQRDFGVYVVGLFDTCEAARAFSESKRCIGLATLLGELLNVHTDKKFQLADWRIRPLPWEYIDYARTDTHYLLHLYDILKFQLLSTGSHKLLYETYESSKEICRYRYDKPTFDNWLGKYDEKYTNQQKYALVELNKWRDQVARKEDDGVGHVASHKILSILSETLPSNREEVALNLKLGGGRKVPDFLERDMDFILQIFEKARSLPLAIKVKENNSRTIIGESVNTKINNLLFFKTKSQNINPNEVFNKILERHKLEGHLFGCPSYVKKILPVATTCERDLHAIFQVLQNFLVTYETNSETVFYGISLDLHSDELLSCLQAAVQSVKHNWIFTTEKSINFCIVVQDFASLKLASLSLLPVSDANCLSLIKKLCGI